MNNNNIDKKKLIDTVLSSNSTISKDAAIKAANSGNADALINSLSKEDKQKLNSILNDRKALEAALKSPQAEAILKMFGGRGKNG